MTDEQATQMWKKIDRMDKKLDQLRTLIVGGLDEEGQMVRGLAQNQLENMAEIHGDLTTGRVGLKARHDQLQAHMETEFKDIRGNIDRIDYTQKKVKWMAMGASFVTGIFGTVIGWFVERGSK